MNDKDTTKEKTPVRELLEWIQAIVIAVVLAIVIRSFVFNVVQVSGPSMETTLQNADRMIVWRLGYEPEQGDIVVFKWYDESGKDVHWIKRVIATEGDTVRIDYATNSVYVNDEKLDEPYLHEPMIDRGCNFDEVKVPEDCVFVMGDNRNNSKDGREIGPVNKNRILGKAVLRFWPFNKIKTY